MLRADADACIAAMRTRKDEQGALVGKKTTRLEPDHVAAALALMCGYFRKKNREPHVVEAARAFGREISKPAVVTDKQKLLVRLERVLEQEEAGRVELAARRVGVVGQYVWRVR